MSKTLNLDDSSGSEDEQSFEKNGNFNINENFAKKFNTYREKEEFQRLKSKYGEETAKSKLGLNDNDSGDDSDSETEDEDAEKWTEEDEKDFFKTLSNLKQKNAKIYDGQTSFFKKSFFETGPSTSKNVDDKPMTLIDLERQVMTEKEGEFEDLADEKLAKKLEDKTHVQEMFDLQSSLKKFAAEEDSDDNDGDSDGDDLLVHKVKTDVEKQKDEEEYRKWMSGHKEHLKNQEDEGELKPLKDFWTDKNLDDGEKFLRDYILNKKFLENNAENDEEDEDDENLSDDERTLEKQEEFEHKYNFRFEDPDQEFIKRFPRTIPDTMRKKDDSRKKKREEVKDRKLREKELKRDELMQLKAMKRKEILEKIQKLRKITGNDELAFKDEDLEDDFDPDKHDERMNQIFQQFDDAPLGEDDEKPVFSDDLDSDLEVENWDEYGVDPDDPDEDFDNAGDEILDGQDILEENDDDKTGGKEQMQKELIEASTSSRVGRKKSKRKSKFAEAIEAEKPVFDPSNQKNFDDYLDEYYKLDYEDIIGGDLPCRFKYRKVAENDLGLSTEEILSAPDRELNTWASLKKTCIYQSEQQDKADFDEYAKKKNNVELKKKILPSLFASNPEENLVAEQKTKAGKSKNARRRRKRNQLKEAEDKPENVQNNPAQKRKIEQVSTADSTATTEEPKPKKKRNKKKKKNNEQQQQQNSKKLDVNKELAMSDVRLEHYGLNKRKVRKTIYNAKNQSNDKV